MPARTVKNIFSLGARELLNKGVLFLIFIVVARQLGKTSLGNFTLAIVISQIVFFISELGLNTLLIRDVSRDTTLAGRYLFNLAVLRILLGLVSLLIIYIISVVIRCPTYLSFLNLLCGCAYFIASLLNLLGAVFRALRKMKYEFYASLLKNLFFLPLGLLAVYKGIGVIGIFASLLFANTIAVLAFQIFLRKVGIRYEVSKDTKILGQFFKDTIPLWIAQGFGVILIKSASPLLFFFRDTTSVGVYNAGYIIFEGAFIFAGIVVSGVFPEMSHQFLNARLDFIATYCKWRRILILTSLPVIIALWFKADAVVYLLFGPGFEEASGVFRILCIASICRILNTLNSSAVISINRHWFLVFIMFSTAVLNLLLCVILIPPTGIFGAGISLLAVEILLLFLMIRTLNKFILDTRAKQEDV